MHTHSSNFNTLFQILPVAACQRLPICMPLCVDCDAVAVTDCPQVVFHEVLELGISITLLAQASVAWIRFMPMLGASKMAPGLIIKNRIEDSF